MFSNLRRIAALRELIRRVPQSKICLQCTRAAAPVLDRKVQITKSKAGKAEEYKYSNGQVPAFRPALRPQDRRRVSRLVVDHFRQEVLMSPSYRNRIVAVRKTFVDVSEMTSEILLRIKEADPGKPVSDGVVGSLRLEALSHEELLQLMSEIVNLPSTRLSSWILSTIEQECCCRISSFDGSSLLFVADVFHVLVQSSDSKSASDFSSDISTRYITAMLKSFDYCWTELVTDYRDVVLLSFHIAASRKSLAHLMHRIEEYVSEHAKQFTGPEISVVCHAFFITNTGFKSYSALEQIASVVARDFAVRSDFKLSHLGCVLKVLRHARYTGGMVGRFYEQLGNKLCGMGNVLGSNDRFGEQRNSGRASRELNSSVCRNVTFNDLNNIAFTYGSLRILHPSLFDWLEKSAVDLISRSSARFSAPRMKDLSRFVWSFANLNRHTPEVLRNTLLSTLHDDPNVIYWFPLSTIEALVALAMSTATYPKDILDRIFSKQFLKLQSQHVREQYYQLLLLNSAARIECRAYNGRYPSDEFMQNVPRQFLGDIDHELATRQGLRRMCDALENIFAGNAPHSMKRVHFILPHSHLADVEIRVDGATNRPISFNNPEVLEDADVDSGSVSLPAPASSIVPPKGIKESAALLNDVNSSNSRSLNSRGSQPLKITERRIVIKLMGHNQYALGADKTSALLGLHEMELRLLRHLGYDVYVVDPVQATCLHTATAEHSVAFVKEFLENTCKVSL